MSTSTLQNPATRIARILADDRCRSLQREAVFERKAIDVEKRTAEISFASDQPVPRWFGEEVLEISEKACDLSRLNAGGPVLVNHDWNSQIGVVERAWIDSRTHKARALVRFSRSPRGEEIFGDIRDGIRRSISVGYSVVEMHQEEKAGGDVGAANAVERFRVTSWVPHEVSIVACPADIGVGVGRSLNNKPSKIISVMETTSPAASSAAEILGASDFLAGRHAKHASAITRAAHQHIREGRSLSEFQEYTLNEILGTRNLDLFGPARTGSSDIGEPQYGLGQRDLSRYSIIRAANRLANNQALDGIEKELNDQLTRDLERKPKGFFVPSEVLFAGRRSLQQRTMLAGNGPDGAFTVGQQVLGTELVDLLRAESHVFALGARVLPGLTGDVSIPRQISGAVCYWMSETGTVTQSSAQFGQIVMKPRRLAASVPYSRQFLAQSSIGAEEFVRTDILKSMAVEIDRVAINGSGGSQPLGILNMASGDRSTSVTFSGAATFAKVLEFEANIGTANALSGAPAFMTTPATKAKWKALQKFVNGGTAVWESDENCAGYRARACTQFPSTPVASQVVFGDWGQVILGDWNGFDIVIDPYSGKREHTVEITINRLMDLVVRQGKSFCISTDSGAQ